MHDCMSRQIGMEVLNLTFHGIGRPGREVPADEWPVWLSGERYGLILDAARDREDVRITFDDGNASDVEVAMPGLLERGLRGTFFVVSGRLDVAGSLGRRDLEAMLAAGMEIGSHGMEHRHWRELDDVELRRELVGAREMLEQAIGRAVTAAACPFGSYDRRVLRALREAGYERVYTSDGGWAREDAWLQARNTLHSMDSAEMVRSWLGESRRSPRALVRQFKLAVKRWR